MILQNVIIRGHFSSLAVNQFPLGNSESEGGVQKKIITFAPPPTLIFSKMTSLELTGGKCPFNLLNLALT